MRRRPFSLESLRAAGRRRPGPGARLRLEALEERRLLATFIVTSTGDDAGTTGTLRWAITEANKTNDLDEIDFAITSGGGNTEVNGVFVIRPQTPLPAITTPMTVDGLSQTGSAADSPKVEIDGSTLAGPTADMHGLLVMAGAGGASGSNSTIGGLAIVNFPGSGVRVEGVSNVTVGPNFLGIDPDGTTARPNGVGVSIVGGAANTVGGQTSNQRNIISGNTGAGIRISGSQATSNVVWGNYIGVSKAGNTAVGNGGGGILVTGDGTANSGARNNTLGGTLESQRNIISGNTGAGVRLEGAGTTGNIVEGNYIGTNVQGTSALANTIGVEIADGATSNTVGGAAAVLRNVISGNAQVGVRIAGASSNLVGANYIGLRADGTAALSNSSQTTAGVLILDGATANTVGGSSSTAGNVISGNSGVGVWVRGRTGATGSFSSQNVLQANFIGTNPAGTSAIPNAGHGVVVSEGAQNTSIGGTLTIFRNVISGNGQEGILLTSFDTTGTTVQGNLIGVQATDATKALGNGGNGVLIDGASNTAIGGTATGAANTLGFNGKAGIRATAGQNNAFRRNSIFFNGGLGIDLGPEGVTPNDPQDPDPGPNLLQNFPVLESSITIGSTTQIRGSLNSRPGRTYTIEFYSDNDTDPTFYGEGRTFIGQTTVTTGTDGNSTFTFTATSAVPLNDFVSAIAIDNVTGDTSEFAFDALNAAPTFDLSVTKSASAPTSTQPNTAVAGAFLNYTVVVTNNGPSQATGVTLTDTLPTGSTFVGAQSATGTIAQSGNTVTLTIGTLAANQSVTLTITVVAPSTVPTNNVITNTATVAVGSDSGTDINPANNTTTLDTAIVPGVDLSLTQSATPNPVANGSQVAILLTVTNFSSTRATNVVLTDILPSNFQYISTSSTTNLQAGDVTVQNGQVVVKLGAVEASGGSVRVTILGQVTGVTIPAGSTTAVLSNSAIVTADQGQTVAGDNVGFVPIFVTSPGTVTPSSSGAPVVSAVARTGNGRRTRLVVGFDQPLQASTAQDLGNYGLTSAGADGQFGTRDDRTIWLASAAYDDATRTVALAPSQGYGRQLLTRLTVRGTAPDAITGTNGLLLDGNSDGQPGGDYVVDIRGSGPVATAAVDAAIDSTRLGRARKSAV